MSPNLKSISNILDRKSSIGSRFKLPYAMDPVRHYVGLELFKSFCERCFVILQTVQVKLYRGGQNYTPKQRHNLTVAKKLAPRL